MEKAEKLKKTICWNNIILQTKDDYIGIFKATFPHVSES